MGIKEAASGNTRLEELLPPLCSEEYAESVIERAQSFTDSLALRTPERRNEVLMGIAMKTLRGRIPGASVASLLSTRHEEKPR